jgi:hypothetical protein
MTRTHDDDFTLEDVVDITMDQTRQVVEAIERLRRTIIWIVVIPLIVASVIFAYTVLALRAA